MSRLLLALLATGASASAQVVQYVGPSPNLSVALDLDTPFVASGPVASTAFAAVGIASITTVGGGFVAAGDVLTPSSNVSGQALVVQGGALAAAGPGEPLDDLGPGDGFDITLAAPVDELQLRFVDQLGMEYQVELFDGPTSLGLGLFDYAGASFPQPPHYWRSFAPFDRAVITFPQGSGGVGLDDLAFGSGPAPPPVSLPQPCVETEPVGVTLVGAIGGAIYFDVEGTEPVEFTGLWTRLAAPAGTPVGLDVYVASGSASGQETDPGAWTLAASDDGSATSAGLQDLTRVDFVAPLQLPAGTSGVALVATGTAHVYTDDPSSVGQTVRSFDGRIEVETVGAANLPFAAPAIPDRVWLGRLCAEGTVQGPPLPPPDPVCVELGYASTAAITGAHYFDVEATGPVRLTGMLVHTNLSPGSGVSMSIYTTAGSYVGLEGVSSAWTFGPSLSGVAAGFGGPSYLTFMTPLELPGGTTGLALVSNFQPILAEESGVSVSHVSADGRLTVRGGSSTDSFSSLSGFRSGLLWSGRLCMEESEVVGASAASCFAALNSTGLQASTWATGSRSVAANDLTLRATGLPLQSMGYFIASRTSELTFFPGGSSGYLCLGGSIGRFVGPGQVQDSGFVGGMSLGVDLTAMPQPTGPVAAASGETWFFQAWFRDVDSGGQPTSNFSKALEVGFAP